MNSNHRYSSAFLTYLHPQDKIYPDVVIRLFNNNPMPEKHNKDDDKDCNNQKGDDNS